jgi:hypothetical protein
MNDNTIDWDGHERRKAADRWKNRRRMAWLAMLGGLFTPLLVLVTESEHVVGIAIPAYSFFTLVVSMYIGGAVIDDNNFKDKE